MRRFVTSVLRLTANIFFRRIEIVGWEKVPSGPVIFAVNHPNGLIDPLFLLCFTPRPVSFLAKAPLFTMPVIGWFVRGLDAIPVYRTQDNFATSQNRETFTVARAILVRGGAIAIFPEGTTHSEPRLKELKTGAARIALGCTAAECPEVVIVPTAIFYTAKQSFRSEALLYFGDGIDVAPATIDKAGEPPRDAVAALTERIESALAALTLQADSREALDLIGRAERVMSLGRAELPEQLVLRRRFIAGYTRLRERDPARLAQLQSRFERFEAELGDANLEPETLPKPTVRGSVRTLTMLLITLPLAVIGAIVHYPAYRLIGFLADRVTNEEELVATIKAVSGMLFYPLTYLVCGILVAWRFGWATGVASALLLPFVGYVALRFFEQLDEVIGRTRALTWRVARRTAFARLMRTRHELRDEIVSLAGEMGV
ncbi:MAG TPA: lysophospholipid acyltransferase family protein [Thermoanaerobaculia bacterium]|jgi:glycerol-3-phosphate O-acyltransferase/dihydroxyacetone phosphate acyltransferase|nr:lysophospholipid acyltransferase family protein [Thermoanaerobaculia bacterium]